MFHLKYLAGVRQLLVLLEFIENQVVSDPAEPKVEFPTCFESCSIHEIADHADSCADIWVGEVEGDEMQPAGPDSPDSVLVQDPIQEHASAIPESTCIQVILSELCKEEVSTQARVNLRRTYIWNDFKDARKKNRIQPNNLVKVVFLGEPAIDDGGPRREFFSGMAYCKNYIICIG